MARETERGARRPYVLPAASEWEPSQSLRVTTAADPLRHASLGGIGLATRVTGPAEFPLTILMQPCDEEGMTGIDPASIRVFRVNPRTREFAVVWSSGLSAGLGRIWARITRPGTYVPIGLPRDPVVRELLKDLAVRRRVEDAAAADAGVALTRGSLATLAEASPDDLARLREAALGAQVASEPDAYRSLDVERGPGATLAGAALPGGATLEELRERLGSLEPLPQGLPEERLFFAPEVPDDAAAELLLPAVPPGVEPAGGLEVQRVAAALPRAVPAAVRAGVASPDWWMFHRDAQHTGSVTGSRINRLNVGRLRLRAQVPLDGPVVSVPSVVDGSIYVGTGLSRRAALGLGGTLFRIDLRTGLVQRAFTFSTPPTGGARQGLFGIACTPAVVDGRVYFSALNGRLYCLDADTLAPIWITNMRQADPGHRQPVTHRVNSEGWSSPLVVNDRVYVGWGEGESSATGFVYCLDARTGDVIWLFCTCRMQGLAENEPNVIPSSSVGLRPLPAGFREGPEPELRGANPWSSAAYEPDSDRVLIGTGTMFPHHPLPQPRYSLGVLSLDAATGADPRFFQPANEDNYRPDDDDTDVPPGPMVYLLDGRPVTVIGAKGGSFFLLDAATLQPIARRQLLPRAGGNGGFPGDTGLPVPAVDPHPLQPGGGRRTENFYGVFSTAAVHHELRRLFVGVGGFAFGVGTPGIDHLSTPFLRALNWDDLTDAWVTAVGPDRVRRYVVPRPPMYTFFGEAGFASPTVVNDVVLMATSRPALYAFDAQTGVPLWAAPGLGPPLPNSFTLGAAVHRDFVVVGSANVGVVIYSL